MLVLINSARYYLLVEESALHGSIESRLERSMLASVVATGDAAKVRFNMLGGQIAVLVILFSQACLCSSVRCDCFHGCRLGVLCMYHSSH